MISFVVEYHWLADLKTSHAELSPMNLFSRRSKLQFPCRSVKVVLNFERPQFIVMNFKLSHFIRFASDTIILCTVLLRQDYLFIMRD